MVTITLCTRQQKRHWCIEQSYGLCGRGRGCNDLGEWHWNMYNILYETSHQSRFDARYWMLGAGALGWPRGMEWGGRREEGSGWGTHVYLWRIHVDIWQNQYNIVKLKNKINLKKIKKKKFQRIFKTIISPTLSLALQLGVALLPVLWPLLSFPNLLVYWVQHFHSIIFFFLFFNFAILYWFCHISTWIRHRYTCVPHPEPSSLPIPSL